MSQKNDNKSLFLYTALIFIVAILMIVLSFFSRINIDKKHSEYTGEDLTDASIAEKTSKLSDENMILLETTRKLNEQNSELEENLSQLNEENEKLQNSISQNDKMYDIFNKIQNNNIKAAAEEFELLDTTDFTEAQQKFYNYLQKTIRKRY